MPRYIAVRCTCYFVAGSSFPTIICGATHLVNSLTDGVFSRLIAPLKLLERRIIANPKRCIAPQIIVEKDQSKYQQGATHRNIFSMANTYTQSYFHLVFSPKNREALIEPRWKDELEKYITGIIQNHRHKLLAINAMPDHIHIFIGYNVNQLIPDLVEEIKTSSNAWIRQKKFSGKKFDWQKGYGAFTHSHAQIDLVVKYINNQVEHHRKRSFREEYLEILQKNDIKFRDEYLFDFLLYSNHPSK